MWPAEIKELPTPILEYDVLFERPQKYGKGLTRASSVVVLGDDSEGKGLSTAGFKVHPSGNRDLTGCTVDVKWDVHLFMSLILLLQVSFFSY
jgi:hypothetical protein